MARLTKLLGASLVYAATAVNKDKLAAWLYSSQGLDLSRSEADSVAAREFEKLSYARASLDYMKNLKNALYSSSALDFSKSEVAANIFPLAESRVDVESLTSMYKTFYQSSGGDLPKSQARDAAMKMAVQHLANKDVSALMRALYSSSGMDLSKSEAQRWVVDLTNAGTDPVKMLETYKQAVKTMPKGQAIQKAMEEGVFAYLNGVRTRYAKDGKLYSAKGYKLHYGDTWMTEWNSAPEERRTANDGSAYTAAEFQAYYGDSWAQKWSASQTTDQKRLASDGKIYNVEQFAAYYHSSWQEQWFKAVDVADDCAYLSQQACNAMGGKCAWKWTGDETDSCVVGTTAQLFA